jgi:IS6 family transposase
MLSSKRDIKAAKRLFKKVLSSYHNQIPRVITVDKNPAYPPAIDKLKNDKILPENVGIDKSSI